jgi:hypothetical protein
VGRPDLECDNGKVGRRDHDGDGSLLPLHGPTRRDWEVEGHGVNGAWLNEAVELPKAALDVATQRVGRFPAQRFGGPTWTGVIMDTNPPDDDAWWYRLAQKRENPKGWEFFRQPGGSD